MKKRLILLPLLCLGTSAAMAAPEGKTLAQADCDKLWLQANPTKAAKISEAEAAAYITDVKAANPDGDGTIEKAEFSKACSGGMIKADAGGSASSGASAGTGEMTGETSDRSPQTESSVPLEQKDQLQDDTSDRTPKQ